MQLVVRLALGWLVNFVALWVAVRLFEGVRSEDWQALAVAALVFGVVNTVVKPVLVILSFPAILLSLGIVLVFINMAMLALTDWIVGGFDIQGFWTYVGATIVVWVVNAVLEALVKLD